MLYMGRIVDNVVYRLIDIYAEKVDYKSNVYAMINSMYMEMYVSCMCYQIFLLLFAANFTDYLSHNIFFFEHTFHSSRICSY